jgi:hypothetical protein
MSCNRIRLVDEPGEEKATVLPLVSASPLMPLSGRAYQNASDPHRHALGIGRHHAEDAVGHGDVDAAGYHRRERGRTAFGVEDFNVEPGLLEVTLLEPDIDEGAVPEPALGDRYLQSFGAGAVRGGNGGQARQQCKCLPHGILPLNCRR